MSSKDPREQIEEQSITVRRSQNQVESSSINGYSPPPGDGTM
nr:hypothetical protein [Gluconobacter oxydans]